MGHPKRRWSDADPQRQHRDTRLTHEAEIARILERLTALSAEHFNLHPDEVTWGHVGTLEHQASRLKDIADAAFGEGEYAD